MSNKFLIGVPALILSLGMSSCLKHNAENLESSGTSVIEFGNTMVPDSYSSEFPLYTNQNLTFTNDTTGFNFIIDYAGAQYTAPEDITVNLAYDSTGEMIDYYDDFAGDDYVAPPVAGNITFPSSVVLKKGEHQIFVHVNIANIVENVGFDKDYALPLIITSVSKGTISSNYGKALLQFSFANSLSGSYSFTGYVFHPSSPRKLSADYTIYAAGVWRMKIPFGDLYSSNYYFKADVTNDGTNATTGSLSNYAAYGATPAAPASGFMDADNPGGIDYSTAAPNAPGTSPWLHSTYHNYYDADAQTFWIHVGYGSGSTSENGWTRQMYMKAVKD